MSFLPVFGDVDCKYICGLTEQRKARLLSTAFATDSVFPADSALFWIRCSAM
jgi:hypothetical protein